MTDFIVIGSRGLSFAAALQAAGIPLFLWLFDDELGQSRRSIARLGFYTAAAALLLTLAYQALEPARMAGDLSGVFDGALQRLFLGSDAGAATAVRALGILLVLSGGLERTRLAMGAAVIGSTLIAASFAFVGHTATQHAHWLLVSLLIVHLIIVAFWFGSLLPIYVAAQCETAAASSLLIERFSALAVWLVPVIFLAGLGMSAVLLPDVASLRSPYGLLLLAKISGFAVLMGLAAINKWRLGPVIRWGRAGTLRTSVLAEWGLIVAVVLATAVMTALFSPTALSRAP